MKTQNIFKRDFTMVVIGQIISLFGNAVVRYALPLYLLSQTHSSALFGIVSALSFLPMVVLAPVGGLIADRVNKRNVMVVLDFFTALLIGAYSILMGHINLVALLITVLMLLYGIQGAYQPAVQASLPALCVPEALTSANAVINMVNSLASLTGPVIGGVIYSIYGIRPILYVSIACFAVSAFMEIFIHIPFEKQPRTSSVLATAKSDMRDSFRFICRDNPAIGKTSVVLAFINLVFSALIIVGIPVIVTQHLGFSESVGSRLYGYAEGALAAGGLIGGMIAGILGARLKVRTSYRMVFVCSLTLLPIAAVLFFNVNNMLAYYIIVASCLAMMVMSTMFSVIMMSFVQRVTPPALIGKAMALISCLIMCAHPIGQALYGILLDKFSANLAVIFIAAFAACALLTIAAKKTMAQVQE